jgi:hypothetical protein
MKTKISFLDAALFLLLAFFSINDAVLANAMLNLSAGRSLEYFSSAGRSGASADKAHFVKAIYTAFPGVYSSENRVRIVVHPVKLERVAK